MNILVEPRWNITRIPIVESDRCPRRVVASGSAIAMEALWLEMIEHEDSFYLVLAPVNEE